MELEYEIQLEQKQLLAPSQIQSLEILAMDQGELSQFLQNEYLENPLLEWSGESGMGAGSEELRKTYEHTVTYGRSYEEMVEEEDKRRRDIPVQDQDQIKNYLLYQLPQQRFSPSQWRLLEYLVDCLDDTGFFTVPLEEVAQKTKTSVDEAAYALSILQGLEPWGIFSPDLKSCLLKQLEMEGLRGTPVWRVVEEHLTDVAEGRISNISRSLCLSTLEVRKCIEQIARLNPRPMREFSEGKANYLVPDIIFRREKDRWEIELNDSWVEDYHINDYYVQMLKSSQDEELSQYFRSRLERVRFVMNSIAQRRQTLLAIAREVLEKQKAYLEGRDFLKPMTMKDVAEAVGIHTSTVSRAIKGKYLQYPGGTLLMKSLFSAPVSTAKGDGAVGTMELKELLRELILAEDKRKPYSDQALAEALKKKNIKLSRRAVTKYREEMGIPGSYTRKELD